MKKLLFIIISAIISYAQNYDLIFNTGLTNLSPIGEFSKRFKYTQGGFFSVGYLDDNWEYDFKIEYFKFDKPNYNKLEVKKKITINKEERIYKIKLPNLKHDFAAYGFSFNPSYNIYKSDLINTNLEFGAGFINWKYNRNSYDSLSVDTSSTAGVIKNFTFERNIPKASQLDWSGYFNIGLNVDINITENLALNLATNYKLIATELWPALVFDMENVSGLQMFEAKLGIKYRLEY